jgi:hypothetical protein
MPTDRKAWYKRTSFADSICAGCGNTRAHDGVCPRRTIRTGRIPLTVWEEDDQVWKDSKLIKPSKQEKVAKLTQAELRTHRLEIRRGVRSFGMFV